MQGIGDDQRLTARQRMRAERQIAMRLRRRHAMARLEPLAVAVDQADERDRHAESVGGEAGEAVEALLGRRIEQPKPLHRLNPLLFVGGQRRALPAAGLAQDPGARPRLHEGLEQRRMQPLVDFRVPSGPGWAVRRNQDDRQRLRIGGGQAPDRLTGRERVDAARRNLRP